MAEGNEPRPFESRIFSSSYTGTTSDAGILTPNNPIYANQAQIISIYANGSVVAIPFVAQSNGTWRFLMITSTLALLKEVEVTITYTGLYV